MEAFATWVGERKKYLLLGLIAFALITFFFPRGHQLFGLIIRGLVLHLFFGETASMFWLGIGYSPERSQILAVSVGMGLAAGYCAIGFLLEKIFRKIFHLGKALQRVASHSLVSKLPYLGIIVVGLLPGGVVAGLIIALIAHLPRLRATAVILGVNFAKLCVLGKLAALSFPYIVKLGSFLHSLIR